MAFFLVRKVRRNLKFCLLGILLLAAAALYHVMIGSARPATSSEGLEGRSERAAKCKEVKADQLRFQLKSTGRANLHAWEDWCGTSVAQLRKNIHFPLRPHTRTTVQKLAVSPEWTNYGLRIFGYLHPYVDGEFVFAVSSDDNSEFWLSKDDSPDNVQLLAWVGQTGAEWSAPGEFTKFASQTSKPVWLSAKKKYFFEVLHKQDDKGTDHVEVVWKSLSKNTEFTVIESSHISIYINETGLLLSQVDHIPQTAASRQHTPAKERDSTIDMKSEDPRDTFYKVPLINAMFLRGILPNCPYKPTYSRKGQTLRLYQAVEECSNLSYVYPNDYTRLTHLEKPDSCFYPEKPLMKKDPAPTNDINYDPRWSQTFKVKYVDYKENRNDSIDLTCQEQGNLVLSSNETLPIVQAFMDKFNEKHPGLFTLLRVVSVVKHADGTRGSRYFLELEVKDENGQVLRLSHYIYASLSPALIDDSKTSDIQPTQPFNQPVLCNPVGLEWSPTSTVHFLVTVKGQGRWVHMLITELEKVYRISGDTNFNLIMVDFNSTDIDMEAALQQAKIPSYQYLKLNGSFLKTTGLQAGIDLVQDKHSIIFICDLHFTLPHFIVDTIRKYTVQGYMAFAPVIMRLHCGSTPEDAKGFWEVNGFGLLGIYKSDLDAAGGMNTKDYTDSWGGEDWEVIDRIYQAGLEVERVYLKDFYHFFHSKRGMWNT